MGRLYLDQGMYDEAIEQLKIAVDKNTAYPLSYYWLGMTYKAKGDNKAAFEAFRRTLHLWPEYEPAQIEYDALKGKV